MGGFSHDFLDFGGFAGEALAQQFKASVGDQQVVFDAHAKIFFRDIDAGLDGDNLAWNERLARVAGIVNVEADIVAEAVDVILAESLTVHVFAVGVDVVVRDFVQAFAAGLAIAHAGFESGEDGILRSENNFVDFAPARGEFSAGGNGASNVGRVAGKLRPDVDDDDIAIGNFAGQFVVVQHGGVGTGADDRSIAFGFGAAHGVNFHHFCGDLILVEAGTHHFHGFELGIEREVDRLPEKSNFPGRFDHAQGFDRGTNVF